MRSALGMFATRLPLDVARLRAAATPPALADVYDALTCKRVYKPAYRHDVACSIILEGRGSHFDPDVVAAFEACADQFQEICRRYQAGAETDEPICDRGPPTPARKGVEAAVSSPDGKVVTV